MGGMRFETTSPQKYLFGTGIGDLNYLGPYGNGNELNLPKLDKNTIKPSQEKFEKCNYFNNFVSFFSNLV